MATRRQVLLGMGVAATAAASPWILRTAKTATYQPLFFSAFDDSAGQHHLAVLGGQGQLLMRAPVAERAHSVSIAPDQSQAIFFARRPGRLAWLIDLEKREMVRTLHAASGRHFYGHGSFSPDGKHLYTSENDYAGARGVIVVRDLVSGRMVDEFDSGGVGPHDLRLSADGNTLIVANGGLHTHPDHGRAPLNLDTMQPNLTYLDRRNGRVLEQVQPPHNQLSIRHLWVTPDNNVAVAMQYKGPVTDPVPLVAFHQRGQTLKTATAPLPIQRQMQAYTASICTDPATGITAVTCPRGGLITLWNSQDQKLIKSLGLADAGGVNLAPDGSGFLISTGPGKIAKTSPQGQIEIAATHNGIHWDNHLAGAAG